MGRMCVEWSLDAIQLPVATTLTGQNRDGAANAATACCAPGAGAHLADGVSLLRRRWSGQIYCMPFEIGQRAVGESTAVRSAQNDTGRLACLECLLPTGCT